jgi:hypothetical protein
MARFRILTAALVLIGLAVPAAANASDRASDPAPRATVTRAKAPAPLTLAASVARRYWGATACGGRVKVLAQRAVVAGLSPDSDAWVTFDSSLGKNNLEAPAASYTNCVITLARWRWPNTSSMIEDWDILCATMVHETGHLLGRVHDATHGSVMVPIFTDHSSVPKLCRSSRPRH